MDELLSFPAKHYSSRRAVCAMNRLGALICPSKPDVYMSTAPCWPELGVDFGWVSSVAFEGQLASTF